MEDSCGERNPDYQYFIGPHPIQEGKHYAARYRVPLGDFTELDGMTVPSSIEAFNLDGRWKTHPVVFGKGDYLLIVKRKGNLFEILKKPRTENLERMARKKGLTGDFPDSVEVIDGRGIGSVSWPWIDSFFGLGEAVRNGVNGSENEQAGI